MKTTIADDCPRCQWFGLINGTKFCGYCYEAGGVYGTMEEYLADIDSILIGDCNCFEEREVSDGS
jgi:hypothetical protein